MCRLPKAKILSAAVAMRLACSNMPVIHSFASNAGHADTADAASFLQFITINFLPCRCIGPGNGHHEDHVRARGVLVCCCCSNCPLTARFVQKSLPKPTQPCQHLLNPGQPRIGKRGHGESKYCTLGYPANHLALDVKQFKKPHDEYNCDRKFACLLASSGMIAQQNNVLGSLQFLQTPAFNF